MIITYYYVDYYVIITSLLRTIIVIMSPLLRNITVIMSPLLRVITVIMSPLLRIITRSIIRNNGLIITYYGPEQLADELEYLSFSDRIQSQGHLSVLPIFLGAY